MLVNGAGAEVAAAGHGHLSLAKTGQQCAQKVVAGAHLAGQVVRDVGAGQMGCVDLVGVAVEHLDLRAQGAQDLQAHRHVTDIRQIFDHTDIRRQNGSRQNADRRILCTGNGDLAVQGLAARNNKFLHFYDLLVKGLCHRPVKVPESIHIRCLCPSCVQSQQSPRTITAILLYTNYTKKQSPDCTSSIIFCFAQNPFRYSENLSLFFKIPTHSGGQTPVCHILPHLILTAGLLDPAQLIGRYQLFEIVHPLP